MNVLVVGAGVIGTVYGAQLSAAGHSVSILEHGPRTQEIARLGLVAHDMTRRTRESTSANVVPDAEADVFELVLIAVRADQLHSAIRPLWMLSGAPTLLFFGNNPGGRSALPRALPGTVHLGFPGVGGSMRDGVAEYTRLARQPPTLETGAGRVVKEFETALGRRGFALAHTEDIDGWLAYHAVFVASVSAALYRCAGDPVALGNDRTTLHLMCRAIAEGFRALRREHVQGLPRNLRALHLLLPDAFAIRYWSRMMRAPIGETSFAAHARHAHPEMRVLADAVLERICEAPATTHLRRLLEQPSRA
jgi:2-dehydropantoate 2-reductase